ncbi:MAG: ATP-binding cassette domain-containing protein, partial [Myxococcota bacterium]
ARVQGSLARLLARVLQRLVPVAQNSYRIGIAGAVNQAVLVGFQGATLALVFAMFTSRLESTGIPPLNDGGFVVFITGLSAFFGATAMLGPAISAVAESIPQYYRLKPIMDTVPEVTEAGRETRPVMGDLSLHDVVFRYAEGLPVVLDGVSVEIRRGEFVAIVGRTGCGKSTLMRLMLGLEKPEAGSVLFDDIPLANLDPSIVRSQLGVVMQSNTILPGDIRSTILGVGTERTLDDAWAAARLVDMEDEIDAMPMGMLTVVGPTTLSASQTQRLLIARALVNRPKILLLDEATSALDNDTQDQIARSIEDLANTRVAIAHRLSTIRKADRIYVLQNGKVVQAGTFDELAASGGHFRELMAGQLA